MTEQVIICLQANLRCAAEHLVYSSITGTVMGESGKYDAFETILEVCYELINGWFPVSSLCPLILLISMHVPLSRPRS